MKSSALRAVMALQGIGVSANAYSTRRHREANETERPSVDIARRAAKSKLSLVPADDSRHDAKPAKPCRRIAGIRGRAASVRYARRADSIRRAPYWHRDIDMSCASWRGAVIARARHGADVTRAAMAAAFKRRSRLATQARRNGGGQARPREYSDNALCVGVRTVVATGVLG